VVEEGREEGREEGVWERCLCAKKKAIEKRPRRYCQVEE